LNFHTNPSFFTWYKSKFSPIWCCQSGHSSRMNRGQSVEICSSIYLLPTSHILHELHRFWWQLHISDKVFVNDMEVLYHETTTEVMFADA
jgi:hypothetical protein